MSTKDPLTPGITMVAEAMMPTANRIIIVDGVAVKDFKVSFSGFRRGRQTETANRSRKAMVPLIPIREEVSDIFVFKALTRTGIPPRINPTKVIQVR